MCCSLLTATLNKSRSGKLATASGHSTVLWPVEKRSIYSSLYWFGFGDKSLSGSTGIFCGWVGCSLEEVLPQVHKQFCKRDIDGHLPVFAQEFSNLAG